MTERLHIEACVVTLPLRLNPVEIAHKLAPRAPQALGKFTTAVTVRYNPDVSTATPGVVALGLTTSPNADEHTISANQPNHIGPVWKPATLILPRERINLQEWTPSSGPSLYLVGSGLNGTVAITVTVKLTLVAAWPPPPDPLSELPKLETQAYVGPVLEGFSLVCCAPLNQTGWNGVGQVINVDLTRAKGHTTRATYGLATPNNRKYVAVRYGCGSSFTYQYNGTNSNITEWKSNANVIYRYTNQDAATSALPVQFYASWRPIHGSTSWWCDITPKSIGNWYYPMCQLILYYYFPGVDVFSSTFVPGVQCLPTDTLPCPAGEAQYNQPQFVPLNMGPLQQLWSRWWNPDFTAHDLGKELQYRFTEAKLALTRWPVDCNAIRDKDGEPAPEMEAHARDLSSASTEHAWLHEDT